MGAQACDRGQATRRAALLARVYSYLLARAAEAEALESVEAATVAVAASGGDGKSVGVEGELGEHVNADLSS